MITRLRPADIHPTVARTRADAPASAQALGDAMAWGKSWRRAAAAHSVLRQLEGHRGTRADLPIPAIAPEKLEKQLRKVWRHALSGQGMSVRHLKDAAWRASVYLQE
jgi:hypothetical protein